MAIEFELNGAPVSVRDDHPHLLAAIREELDVTSPKDGCSPSGQCGCCTLMIDGKVQVSCQYAVSKVAGKQVTTLEGVAEEERNRFAEAFAACGGLQCGFCIPGIVMRAKAQIDKKGADLEARGHGPPPRRAPVPLHRVRQGARRHRGRRPGHAGGLLAARRRRHQRCQVRGAGAVPRRPRLRRRHPRARDAARCAAPHRAHPRRHPAHRHHAGQGRARRGRRVHRRRHPRQAVRGDHLQGLAGVHRRGPAHLVRRRRAGDRRRRDPPAGPRTRRR